MFKKLEKVLFLATCVIHNDWRLDSIVRNAGDLSVNGVLDWELANLGDSLIDLGSAPWPTGSRPMTTT